MGRYDEFLRSGRFRSWQKATAEQRAKIEKAYPSVASDYLQFLTDVGYGRSDLPLFRLYAALSPATDVYGDHNPELSGILLFGDDCQGFTSGFNGNWEVVQLNSADGPVEFACPTFEEFMTFLFLS